MVRKLIVCFILVSSGCAFSQSTTIRQLDSLLLNSEYEAVIQKVDASTVSDPIVKLQLNYRKGQALTRSGKLDEANTLLTKLRKDARELSNNQDFAGALINTGLGSVSMNQGRYDLALEFLQNALEGFERSSKSTTLEAADAISALGIVYNATGKSQQAEEQLLRAYSIRQNQLPENHELIAASLNDLGLVYSSTNPDKALDYYDKALAIYEQIHGHDHPKIAIANTNLGFVYGQIELYGDAINSLETALKIWEKVYTQPHPSKAFVLRNLGQVYVKMRNNALAEEYFEKALKMYEASYGTKHPDLASTLNAIGNIKLAQNQFDEALADFQNAIIGNVRDFESRDLSNNPRAENFYNGNVLLYSLLYKAEAFEGKYFGETLKFKDLLQALQAIQKCDTLIDKLRQQTNNESDKIALGTIANEAYSDGVRVAYTLAENAWSKRQYRELAFYFAEKSKSAVLLGAISDANAKSFAGIPDELLEEEKYLKALAAYCTQKLAQKPSPDEEKSLRDILFQVNRDYQAYVENLEKKFPEYFNLKFNTKSPTISQIQEKLDNQTAILSYFLDESNSRLYIFVITRKSYRVLDNVVPPHFDRMITGLRNAMFYNEINTFKSTARELGQLVIPHLPARTKDLVVIPTGRLGIIPYEALLVNNSGNTAYSDLPYLIRSYSVSYEFSAGLILQKDESGNEKLENPSILLCAPVTFDEGSNLSELPGTENEVNEISDLFVAKSLRSVKLVNDQAVEDQIKSSATKDYSILHFATHGIVDEESPELSRIFLKQGSADDGNLFSGEIYNMELKADLVTLSACETGLGKISKGEGVIGLSRALVYAGAHYIIVSFWSVADASTSQLMTDFYDQLLMQNKKDFGDALRQAKLKMLNSGKTTAPYYWAPFVIIGY